MRLIGVGTVVVAAALAGCSGGSDGAAPPQPTTGILPTTTARSEGTVTTGPTPPSITPTTGASAGRLNAPLTEVVDFPGPPDKGQVGLTPDRAGGRVCYDFELRETDEPTETHVHQGPVQTSSPVVLTLHPRVGKPGQTRGGLTDGRGGYVAAQGCEPAGGSLLDGLHADPGSYYVEVHTAEAPAGAVRGRLAR